MRTASNAGRNPPRKVNGGVSDPRGFRPWSPRGRPGGSLTPHGGTDLHVVIAQLIVLVTSLCTRPNAVCVRNPQRRIANAVPVGRVPLYLLS
jgi:hypothetical protein